MTPLPAGATEPPEEFSRWALRKSGQSHEAIRKDRPTTAQIKAGAKLLLDADTLDELIGRLRDEERLLAKVKP